MNSTVIVSTGRYLPDNIIPNSALTQFSREAQSLIGNKTGVLARRHAGEDQCTSDLALEAARSCLGRINFPPEDIEGIILSTSSPDRIQPATASRVQHLLGAKKAFAGSAAWSWWETLKWMLNTSSGLAIYWGRSPGRCAMTRPLWIASMPIFLAGVFPK